MWHSPDYEIKSVPVKDVYGGPPGPDIDVQEWHFEKLNLCTGQKIYGSSGYDYLTEGPKLLNQLLGRHYVLCSPEWYAWFDLKHVTRYQSRLKQEVQELLMFMSLDETSNCFRRRKSLRLTEGASIGTGSVFDREGYRWQRNFFEWNNRNCTFEQLLRQTIERCGF